MAKSLFFFPLDSFTPSVYVYLHAAPRMNLHIQIFSSLRDKVAKWKFLQAISRLQ